MRHNQTVFKTCTSLDIIKAIAIFIMIIDHIGFYFWPENLWLRAFGRWCVPIWFFLIGYGRQGQALEKPLIYGTFLLMLANPLVGLPILPLNILPSMMLARAVLPRLMHWLGGRLKCHWVVFTICVLAAPITNLFWEYGTLGLLIAMFGWLVRQQRQQQLLLPCHSLVTFGGLVAIATIILEQITFQFSVPQMLFMGLGVVGFLSYLFLYLHTPREAGWLPKRISPWAGATYQWLGRHSLQVYVVHLLIFKLLAVALGQTGFMWGHWRWL